MSERYKCKLHIWPLTRMKVRQTPTHMNFFSCIPLHSSSLNQMPSGKKYCAPSYMYLYLYPFMNNAYEFGSIPNLLEHVSLPSHVFIFSELQCSSSGSINTSKSSLGASLVNFCSKRAIEHRQTEKEGKEFPFHCNLNNLPDTFIQVRWLSGRPVIWIHSLQSILIWSTKSSSHHPI